MCRGSVWPVLGRNGWKIARMAATAAIAFGVFAADGIRAASGERTISIYNIHTKETVSATFKRDGVFDKDALARINHVMRDWRIDEPTKMDAKLVDLLWEVHRKLGSRKPIHLISGFRSSKINEMLRRTRGGQAKKSLHIQGMAADVYFPDVPLERLRNVALAHARGGVGYYPRSGHPFVHVDTGSVRHWPRLPEDQLASIMKNGRDQNHSRSAPRALPEPTRLASAVFAEAAPPPRAKPARSIPHPSTLRLASAGEPVLQPLQAAEPAPAANQVRDWGQSLLLPSAPRAAGAALGTPSGASRVVVTASATPVTKSEAPFGAPLNAGLAVSYAGLPKAERDDRVSGLLSNGAGDLTRLLAEAQLIDGSQVARTVNPALGSPTDLRPAVLMHSRAELPSQNVAVAAPVMTASLTLGVATARISQPSLSQRLRAKLGGPSLTAPSTPPMLASGSKLLKGLLRAPASQHSVTFTRVASLSGLESTFAPRADDSAWHPTAQRSPTVSSSDDGFAGQLAAMAERAFGWIFGN